MARYPYHQDPDGSRERAEREQALRQAQEREAATIVRKSAPVSRSPMARDTMLLDALSRAAGELLGTYAKETDGRIKSIVDELAAVKLELQTLRARIEAQPAPLKRIA